jgi:hypothetical protein
MQAGLPSFVLNPNLWVEKTNTIGIFSNSGRYGGTFAHEDIAFEFASAISPEFKLYLIKEYQRLKESEMLKLNQEWNIQRQLSNQLIVLTNLENIYSLLIAQGEPQYYRLTQLNRIAISQMKSLVHNQKKLKKMLIDSTLSTNLMTMMRAIDAKGVGQPKAVIDQVFEKNLKEISKQILGDKKRNRISFYQQVLFQKMASDAVFQEALLKYYELNRDNLAFEIK